MRIPVVCCRIVVSLALFIPTAFARKAKPIRVQLYGDSFDVDEQSNVSRTAFLILPDGSHAEALCLDSLGNSCNIEPFAAEKRLKVSCDLLKGKTDKHVNCYQSEIYDSERKNNDITLHTGVAGSRIT
jgi:hypothetical protein